MQRSTRRSARILVVLALVAPLVAACEGTSNQDRGQVVGTAGGAVGGALLASALGGGTNTRLIAAALGGVAGYFAGSAIGRSLDERDRATAQAATQRVLDAPTPPPAQQPAPSTTARPQAAPRQPVQTATWTSDRNQGVRGSSSVVGTSQAPDGATCKTVREIAYVGGREVAQDTRYCRQASGGWAVAQA